MKSLVRIRYCELQLFFCNNFGVFRSSAPGTAIIMIIIHTLAVECSLGSVRHHYLGEADGLPAQLWCDPQMDDSEKCRSGGHTACRAASCVGAAARTGLSKPT